jgi:hypothetical protein
LTLESGHRWFTIGGDGSSPPVSSDSVLGLVHFPSSQAIITIIEGSAPPNGALDAVTVIRETNEIAGNRLSAEASQALERVAN